MDIFEKVCSVRLDDENDQLVLLDQTLLPNETRYLYLNTPEEIYEAIYYLRVRGAPAIGVSAAYGVYLTTKHYEGGREDFDREFTRIREYLNSSRPTAVNLSWALNRMGKVLEDHPEAKGEAAFALIQDAFSQKSEELETTLQDTGAKLEHAFDFMEAAFGQSQEMVIFITELSVHPFAIRFLAQHPCDR